MRYLVTGASGFIGYHVSERLLAEGHTVVGADNMNAYYDPALKRARLERLRAHERYTFMEQELSDRDAVARIFADGRFDTVIHLAAQAGVRYSLQDPHAYVDSNLVAFVNVLEGCRHAKVGHLVFASSSSVYGGNTKLPFSVHDNVDHPLSLYAATKKANELLAHSYAHLYRLPVTGLRFFTVYGPWGRPDMAMYIFTKAILSGEPLRLFNRGKMQRDFTYIDDIVEGVVSAAERPAAPDPAFDAQAPDPAHSNAPYRVFNIGNNQPVELENVVALLEQELGRKAQVELAEMQPGDVQATYADIAAMTAATGFIPRTPIEVGVRRFVDWYRSYHRES